MKKQICILGSTGSIGTQALDVISQHEDLYEAYCLTANTRIELLAEQAHRFHPAAIVVADETKYQDLCRLMDDMPEVKVYAGAQALCDIVEAEPIDMVLTAMVGFSGLEPTIHAIKAKKKICLANKHFIFVTKSYRTDTVSSSAEFTGIFFIKTNCKTEFGCDNQFIITACHLNPSQFIVLI